MHYKRWLKSGDVGGAESLLHNLTGMTCQADGCDLAAQEAPGYCKKHGTRYRRHGDPNVVHPRGSKAGPGNPTRLPDHLVTYNAAHLRLKNERGRASAHPCQQCGKPASQWSYNHANPDPNELVWKGMPYSGDPNYYQPLCVPCHKRLDLARLGYVLVEKP